MDHIASGYTGTLQYAIFVCLHRPWHPHHSSCTCASRALSLLAAAFSPPPIVSPPVTHPQSRCTKFRFSPLDANFVRERLTYVVEQEKWVAAFVP